MRLRRLCVSCLVLFFLFDFLEVLDDMLLDLI
jgi:hypothetical protein